MAWLCIHNFNGKDYYSVAFTSNRKTKEYQLGEMRYIEITDAEAALSLDKLTLLYQTEQAAKAAPKPTAEELDTAAREQKALEDLLYRVVRIIKESVHPGEVEGAKGFYLKLTGKEYGK